MDLIGAEALASELLKAGLSVRFIALGQSMHPFIEDGAVLQIVPCNGSSPDKFRKGDILFCNLSTPSGELVLVHRLLRILPNGRLLTKGDNQPHPDRPVEIGQVLGRVQQIEQANRLIKLDLFRWRWCGWVIATRSNCQLFFLKVWGKLKKLLRRG